MKREKNLILEYGVGSVTYTDIRNFEIQYPYIVIDGENISLVSVRFVKYKNFIAWKNRKFSILKKKGKKNEKHNKWF
jgi:hypothetical protein|nr:MAG TPA: hypothetical protein [Caudoviricetes sp.]